MVNQVAAVVVYRSSTKTNRLPNTASIFSAELYTISLALAVSRHTKDNNFLMFISYFMSSLQALSRFKLEIHFFQHIIKDHTHLTNSGKLDTSHVNILGHDRADTAAKSTLSLPIEQDESYCPRRDAGKLHTEARMLLRHTCERVPNMNEFFTLLTRKS